MQINDQLALLETSNPLLVDAVPPVVDPAVIRQAVIRRPIPDRRQVADMRRLETAREAIAPLERDGMELYGLTRGQFSLSDMLEAITEKTGPAELSISTWTAAGTDVRRMLELLESGRITACRWLVDQTFIRRCPSLVAQIRRQFGADAIRVSRTHAKFAVVSNERWKVALRSSMNLNQNPRLESFEVGHDPLLCRFLIEVLNDIWRRQDRKLADASTRTMTEWFHACG
jgi:hypothetical protein